MNYNREFLESFQLTIFLAMSSIIPCDCFCLFFEQQNRLLKRKDFLGKSRNLAFLEL
jgi:hypothetical protein